MSWRHILLLCGVLSTVCCQTRVSQSTDGSSGVLSFKTPELDDEEGNSPWIPDNLRCDACKAVAYQLWSHFDKYNAKHKYREYKLKEWEILDITEQVCGSVDIFNNYGIKEVNGVHRLSGVGLETHDLPGVIAGGGKWPSRLQGLCEEFMGDVGEDQIYDLYKTQPDDRMQLENFLCQGPANTVRGQCTKNYSHKEQTVTEKKGTSINDEL